MEIKEGMRFARLVVVNKIPGSRSRYHCICDCGKEIDIYGSRLKSGRYKSCGCLNDETRKMLIRERSLTHGMANTILYSKYCSMKARCHNKNYKYYHRYGGRGIKICQEWLDSFQNFATWAYQSGYDDNKKGYEQTLDRIDNDGDYCPENCRWVNQMTQTKNRSNSVLMTYNGEKLTYVEFAKRYNISSSAFVRRRYEGGQTPEQILNDWECIHQGDVLTLREAIDYYSVDRKTILKWIEEKRLNACMIGNRWVIQKQ